MTLLSKAQPLPQNYFQLGTAQHAAYDSCLTIELLNDQWTTTVLVDEMNKLSAEDFVTKMPPRVAGRALGYFLHHAPYAEGLDCLSREINDCNNDQELMAGLAHLYIYGLIGTFLSPNDATSTGSTSDNSPMSDSKNTSTLEQTLEDAKATPGRLRTLLLARDDNRCVFSGDLEWDIIAKSPASYASTRGTSTDVAYLITESRLTKEIVGMSPRVGQRKWATCASALIEQYGGLSVEQLLGSEHLHDPQNAFIVGATASPLFSGLNVSLQTAIDHHGQVLSDTYEPVFFPEYLRCSAFFLTRITFRTVRGPSDQVHVSPPHPQLLRLHAVCARVAHMSGAVQVLEEAFRVTEPIHIMTSDPRAATDLARALTKLQFS